ncbi:MAG: hypothetical protein JRN15_11915 [Nitrososphaerota archaeon]|nr:hypothetical protein [Nitrososphaerota archaeon]
MPHSWVISKSTVEDFDGATDKNLYEFGITFQEYARLNQAGRIAQFTSQGKYEMQSVMEA